MTNVLFAGRPDHWPDYQRELPRALAAAGVKANVTDHLDDPAGADFIVYAPNGPVSDFTPFTNARAVLSLWAGVEKIVGNKSLTQPLTRMVDPGLTQGMQDYVCGHVLGFHLGTPTLTATQDGTWRNETAVPPLASERRVGILGKGALGMACARALVALGFPVSVWGRTDSPDEGSIQSLNGPAGLTELLKISQILVGLLPNTPETAGFLSENTLAELPKGACIINAGRGELIDDDALLAALETGQIFGAALDVFKTEPLPPAHPYWAHPRVLVTPHIAAETRASSASGVIAENIRRSLAGEPLLYLVDRSAGY